MWAIAFLIIASSSASGWTHGGRSTPSVVLNSVDNQFGTYNLNDGTKGPYWSNQGVWNNITKSYLAVTFRNGSTTVTGFSSTATILPGYGVYSYGPKVTSDYTTVVSVGTNSIVMSAPATADSTTSGINFGLINNGVFFNQTITNYPSIFPNGTVISWSYPSQMNDNGVYSYPNITYGTDGGYNTPANMPTPIKPGSFSNLSVTYNITVSAGTDDYDCLIETWPATVPNPPNPQLGVDKRTNEIGFLCHTPAFLAKYILSLTDHFNYSSGGFNAYVATRPGTPFSTAPPFTMIMPVTAPNGTTPLDMTSGQQSMPIKGVINELVSRGILSGDSYITGFQFGFEVGRNSGSVTMNSISWSWN